MKKTLLVTLSLAAATCLQAQNGSITQQMLNDMKAAHPATASARALRNALAATDINSLARTADNPAVRDVYFSDEVKSKGVADQKQSGRCWLFTGLNVMRARMIQKEGLGEFQFSQSYLFFYDQLEKSNLFLQAVIDNAAEPMDSQLNTWLFQHPLSDGGTFAGVQALVQKYGVVPAEVMPESFNANNTSRLSSLLSLKLRQYGLELRTLAADGKKGVAAASKRKAEMLSTVYRILTVTLGTPPETFSWTPRDGNGKALAKARTYTPQQFFAEHVGADLAGGYVMLMNDPTRPYHQLYSVDYDRHTYDSPDWTYINLPMEELEQIAIASIKDSTMLYMSCDVGKQYDSKTGVLSLDNFDYGALFDTDFPMTKAERIRTFASASSHAMTLMAVDLDAQGKPLKWKVENSWGPTAGYKGHLIMTEPWFREYLFRIVAERKYVPAATLEILKQKPVRLPAWDPLFAEE